MKFSDFMLGIGLIFGPFSFLMGYFILFFTNPYKELAEMAQLLLIIGLVLIMVALGIGIWRLSKREF
jgi:uncharacterized membrane protein